MIIAPSSTRRLIEHVATTMPLADRTPTAVLDSLTEREREVLVLIARGRTNSDIAGYLFVAEATVKTHVGRILAKLGARDRVQIVVTAYETGLMEAMDDPHSSFPSGHTADAVATAQAVVRVNPQAKLPAYAAAAAAIYHRTCRLEPWWEWLQKR